MSPFFENLAHFTHGMAFALFLLSAVFLRIFMREGRLAKFLFVEMVFWAFIQLKDFGYLIPGYWHNEYASNIHLSIDNWCVPITMLLFFEIVSPKWVTLRKAVLVVVPPVLLTLLYILVPSQEVFMAGIIYSLLLGVFSVATVYMASARYDNFIKRNFSYLENINLQWMRRVILFLFVLLVVWVLETNFSSWLNDAFYYLFAIGIWGVVFYYTATHEVVDVPDYISPLSPPENDKVSLPDDRGRLETRLRQAMVDDKSYLDPTLSLVALARKIGTNRSYLSEYINNHLGSTFYEYVNSFRIADAQRMLREDTEERFSQEYIAEKCGFYSLSTFRRSFHKETGITPGKYRQKYR